MMLNSKTELPVTLFEGMEIFSGSMEILLDYLRHQLEATPQGQKMIAVMTPNPEQWVLAEKNREFAAALKSADILLPDGSGLVWAINRQLNGETAKLQRIAGREVFHALLEISVKTQSKVFFLGGKNGSSREILSLHRMLQASYDDGPKESVQVQHIVQYRPDILFIAYGAPWQELWLAKNRELLAAAGVRLAMVVGGAFEYESGRVAPVPSIFLRYHLEWLYRLLQEPSRWRRQLAGLWFFLKRVVPH